MRHTVVVYTRNPRLERQLELALEDVARLLTCEEPQHHPVTGATLTLLDLDSLGEEACARIQESTRGPVIPLSREADRLPPSGMLLPLSLSRLLADPALHDDRSDEPTDASHSLLLLPERRDALLDGRRIHFSELEYALLSLLAEADGQYVSRDEIAHRVWDGRADARLINVYIHYLREKMERKGERLILSSRGRGYCLLTGRSHAETH